MADLELNKLFAAPLVAGVAFMGAGLLGELIVHPHRLETSAIRIGDAPRAAAPAAAAPAAIEPVGPLMAAASAENGRALAQRNCAACHSFNDGGRNGVGPNLYGILGKNHAQTAGFNYSVANRALAGKLWGYEEMSAFLLAPARAMPGTRMAFAGLASNQQRADVIAYLRTLAVSPMALP